MATKKPRYPITLDADLFERFGKQNKPVPIEWDGERQT